MFASLSHRSQAPALPFIGLTGGISAGKSTVADMFREFGALVFDADQLARDVVAPGRPALEDIIASFGPDIVTPAGTLDRKRLGAIVFADPLARRRLEAIMHPAIAEELSARIADAAHQGRRWVLYEAALLVETGQHENLDALVVVTAPEQEQIQRTIARDGLTTPEARARIAAQLPLAAKIEVADHIIDNAGSLLETHRQVEALFQLFEQRWGKGKAPV